MVSIITCCIKHKKPLYIIALILCSTTQANFWDDAVKALKNAANRVEDGFKEAGKEIEKGAKAVAQRFSNTKTTRAIDYGVRKAVLETALATAIGVLEISKKASTGTLIAAEETAKAGLTAAEHFLSDVVRAASPKVLQASATTAKGFLEGVKQIGVGALQGTEWVVNQATSTIDINRVRYQGDLKRLKTGVLGDMLCEGVAFKKSFSFAFDLDPRSLETIGQSIVKLIKNFEQLFNENIANPIKNAFSPLKQQVDQAEKAVTLTPPPSSVINLAIEASKQASAIVQSLTTQEQKAQKILQDGAQKLQEIAQKNNQELQTLIRQGTTTSSADSALARQELIKRLKNKPS